MIAATHTIHLCPSVLSRLAVQISKAAAWIISLKICKAAKNPNTPYWCIVFLRWEPQFLTPTLSFTEKFIWIAWQLTDPNRFLVKCPAMTLVMGLQTSRPCSALLKMPLFEVRSSAQAPIQSKNILEIALSSKAVSVLSSCWSWWRKTETSSLNFRLVFPTFLPVMMFPFALYLRTEFLVITSLR